LANAQAAENFLNALPSDNAIADQRALCDALARIGVRRGPDQDQLRALATMDRKSRRLRYELISDYLATAARSPERERELRHAVFELSRSFARGYEIFLLHARVRSMLPAWRRYVPAIVVALFGHREVELLLSLFRYEAWPRGRWRELLAAYQFVQTAGLSAEASDRSRCAGRSGQAARRAYGSRVDVRASHGRWIAEHFADASRRGAVSGCCSGPASRLAGDHPR
jgi:hypothetical protein